MNALVLVIKKDIPDGGSSIFERRNQDYSRDIPCLQYPGCQPQGKGRGQVMFTAKVLVIAISDAAATRRIVQIARKGHAGLYIIVRTRYVSEVDDLIKLGANEVIPEEFETSIEIFSRVLDHYHVPGNVIKAHIDNVRKNSYSILRGIELPKKHLAERYELLKGIETETYLLKKSCSIVGCSLKALNLRSETGATIIAVKRGDTMHQNPPPDFILMAGDILLFIGNREDINHAIEYLELRQDHSAG